MIRIGMILLLGAAAHAGEADVTVLYDRAVGGVAVISCPDSFGTGFFVDGETLLTANHVAPCERPRVVLRDGKVLESKVLERAKDEQSPVDLCLIHVDKSAGSALPLGKHDPRIGSFVVAIGHAKGAYFSINSGILSNVYQTSHGQRVLQTQLPLYPGSSGGPLLDENGRVVGVVTAGITETPGINFAIPISVAFHTLSKLK